MNQSKEGALGEAVCQAQGLTKPNKSLRNFNDSMTI